MTDFPTTPRARRRSLSAKDRLRIFAAHEGVCHLCSGKIHVGEAWEVSHEIPLELRGADDDANMRPAHKKCHRSHTSTVDIPAIAKAKRREARHIGAKPASKRPIPGSRASGIRKRFNGTVERWS